MQVKADRPEAPSAIRSDVGAIFVSLELKPFNLVDRLAVAGRRREDVETQCARWGHRRVVGAVLGDQA
jgi:hypothetical protein